MEKLQNNVFPESVPVLKGHVCLAHFLVTLVLSLHLSRLISFSITAVFEKLFYVFHRAKRGN